MANAPKAQVFDTIAVIGSGLIGASIIRACEAFGIAQNIHVYDADENVRQRSKEIKLGQVFDRVEDAVKNAQLVVLCTPVGKIKAAAKSVVASMPSGAILTDVGSVKESAMLDMLEAASDRVYVVPGHPIAGTENSGPDAGFASLFDGRWCIVTPMEGQSEPYQDKVDLVVKFWEKLGSKVELMTPKRHDIVLAITSHIPHLIAYNIVATANDMEDVTQGEVVKYSAGGFRDFTRIAASDPIMWRDVFLNNKDAVLEVLGRFSEDLSALQRAIRWSDGDKLFDLFTHAREIRKSVIEAGQDTAAPNFGREQND
jgi:cyclohexadieny/prephenate dehydrogenase